jgi:hypothetical protein
MLVRVFRERDDLIDAKFYDEAADFDSSRPVRQLK